MTKILFEIVSRVMNIPIEKISDSSGPDSIPDWDSFNMFVLLDEIEKEFDVKFSLEETLEIKNVGDFRKQLEKHGVNLNEWNFYRGVQYQLKLHHIGIVVENIQKSLGELTKYLDFESTTMPSLVGSQKVNICFLKTNNVFLELIEPAEENSPISNFIKKGGGFHHLCFEVDDIHLELEKMKKNGARIVVDVVKGFEERLTAFVMLDMKNTNCNLIELAEKK